MIRSWTTTWATRAASSSCRAACSSSSAGGLADGAGALAVPPALPHPLPQLLDPPALGRTPARLVALQQAQLGEVAGHLLVGRRPHRSDPADQRPGPLGPLEDQGRVAVLDGQRQAHGGEVAAVTDQGALQVEAAERGLPGVQVGQARRARAGGRAGRRRGPRASSARTSRQSSRVVTGEPASSRHPAQPGAGRRRGRRGPR